MYEECSENGTVDKDDSTGGKRNVKEIQKKEDEDKKGAAATGALLYSESEGNARVGDAPAATAVDAAREGDEGEGAPGEKEKMRDESPAPLPLRPLPPPSAPGALANDVSAADGEPPLLLGLVKRRWCAADDVAIDIAELCGCCGVWSALCGVDSREADDKCMGESAVCKPRPPSANTSEGVGLAGDSGNRC